MRGPCREGTICFAGRWSVEQVEHMLPRGLALEGACGAEGLNNDLLYSNPACDERAANG
jgi:hypothetical protein